MENKDTPKEKQKQQYNEYVKQVTPTHNLFLNMLKAFLIGGIICVLGQFILNYCEKLGLDPSKCLMVGNDFTEDLAAAKLGMETYLVTDCLIAPEGADLSVTRHGTMDELCALVEEFPLCRQSAASASDP